MLLVGIRGNTGNVAFHVAFLVSFHFSQLSRGSDRVVDNAYCNLIVNSYKVARVFGHLSGFPSIKHHTLKRKGEKTIKSLKLYSI